MVFGMAFSMLADICDLDEIETNKRREGSYCAVYQWITKMGFSLAFMAGGLVLMKS
jgi:GPH family glycoside/pentoside/hexuronide:cation symporter